MTAVDGASPEPNLFAPPPPRRVARTSRGAPSRNRKPDSSGSLWGLLCILAFVVMIALYATQATKPSLPLTQAIVAMPVILLVGWAFVRRIHDPDYDIRSVMYLGLIMRLIGAYMRMQNTVDSQVYHVEGVRIAASFRQFDFGVDTGRQIPGTGAVRWISALVHVFTFDDMGTTFLVFTLFSFIGCYYLYRAFRLAVPDGDRYRYAILLFLWPSLCYWPSSLGKEAWMLLGIGVASYGAALVFVRRSIAGFLALTVGVVGLTYVRPHVSLIVFIAMFVAFLAKRDTSSRGGAAVKSIGLVILILGGSVLVGQTSSFFKVDDTTGADYFGTTLDNTTAQTTQGNSAFSAHQVRTPIDFPWAFVTVVFRPFLTETHDLNGAITALESSALLVILAGSTRRLSRLPRLFRSTPYITYALMYSTAFVYAFSSIGNFGILARQRTQLAPLLLVFAALPAEGKVVPRFGAKRRRAEAEARREHAEVHRTWRDHQRVRPIHRRATVGRPLDDATTTITVDERRGLRNHRSRTFL